MHDLIRKVCTLGSSPRAGFSGSCTRPRMMWVHLTAMDDRSLLTSDENRTVGETLRAVARDCLVEARAAIVDPAKSEAEAVHDFRRAMKRWRALLRLVEPFVGPDARRLRDEARDRARALSGARDGQSAL